MTFERMVQDGIEVSDYIKDHLHKQKIVLFGRSWGSLLGVNMVMNRPDLFCAYVGTAQVVRFDFQSTYEKVLAMATAANNQAAINYLTAIGPPTLALVPDINDSYSMGSCIRVKARDAAEYERVRRIRLKSGT